MAAPTLSEAPRREKCVSRNWSAIPLTALPTVKASVTVTVSSFFLASGSRFDLDTSPQPTPRASQNLRLPSSQSKSHRGYFKYAPPPPLRDHAHHFESAWPWTTRWGQTLLGNSDRELAVGTQTCRAFQVHRRA